MYNKLYLGGQILLFNLFSGLYSSVLSIWSVKSALEPAAWLFHVSDRLEGVLSRFHAQKTSHESQSGTFVFGKLEHQHVHLHLVHTHQKTIHKRV